MKDSLTTLDTTLCYLWPFYIFQIHPCAFVAVVKLFQVSLVQKKMINFRKNNWFVYSVNDDLENLN